MHVCTHVRVYVCLAGWSDCGETFYILGWCLLAGGLGYVWRGSAALGWAGLATYGGRRWNAAWLLDACAGTLGSRCNLHARGLASQTTGERCRMDGWVHRGETGVSSRW